MFVQNNEGFTCEHCARVTLPHPSSSRDHCAYCLYSKHVDLEPGDRKNPCGGIMEPIGLEIKEGKTQIVFCCIKCKEMHRNIIAPDDNSDKIVELSARVV